MRRRLALFVCALAALAFVACGDDDGGGSGAVDCSTFAACGGDLTGTWTIQDGCVGDFNPLEDFCPEATVDLSGIVFGGTVEYGADGTYSVSSTQSGSLVVEIPGSCLDGVGSCDDLDSDDSDCSGDVAVSCTCTSSAADSITETGTYATSGNDVTLTPDGEDAETSQYCVDGDTLLLNQADDDVEITFALTRN